LIYSFACNVACGANGAMICSRFDIAYCFAFIGFSHSSPLSDGRKKARKRLGCTGWRVKV
jgi:hypothetical protein